MSNETNTPADQRLLVWLDAASSMFGGVALNPSAKQVWLRLMSKYRADEVDNAFARYVENGVKMPMPSDIKSLIEGGTAKERALGAWTKVVAAMGDVGEFTSICFDDPLIHLVVLDMGGWTMMCRTTDDKLSFAGHEFQKRYLTMMGTPKESLKPVPRSLAGAMVTYNSGKENAPPERVVLYGDEDTAEMLFQTGIGSGTATLMYRKPSLASLGYTPMSHAAAEEPKQLSY